MDSYIVRIYRYEPAQPGKMVGVLRVPDEDSEIAFIGIEELWTAIQQSQNTQSTESDYKL